MLVSKQILGHICKCYFSNMQYPLKHCSKLSSLIWTKMTDLHSESMHILFRTFWVCVFCGFFHDLYILTTPTYCLVLCVHLSADWILTALISCLSPSVFPWPTFWLHPLVLYFLCLSMTCILTLTMCCLVLSGIFSWPTSQVHRLLSCKMSLSVSFHDLHSDCTNLMSCIFSVSQSFHELHSNCAHLLSCTLFFSVSFHNLHSDCTNLLSGTFCVSVFSWPSFHLHPFAVLYHVFLCVFSQTTFWLQ